MRPQAVTFDFHNTLARCDQWFQLEVRDLLPAFLQWHARRNGTCVSDAILGRSVELYRTLRLEIMEHGVENDAATCVELVTRELGYVIPSDIIEQGLHDTMRATLADSTPIDGVVCSVRALHREGVKLGVVSSAVYHPFLEWSLAKFGIDGAFETIVTSAESGYYKSRTEIYEIALKNLGVSSENAVHVGDSIRFDVATAAKLGMRTVWLNSTGDATCGDRADATVTTLVGLDRLLLNGLREHSV